MRDYRCGVETHSLRAHKETGGGSMSSLVSEGGRVHVQEKMFMTDSSDSSNEFIVAYTHPCRFLVPITPCIPWKPLSFKGTRAFLFISPCRSCP